MDMIARVCDWKKSNNERRFSKANTYNLIEEEMDNFCHNCNSNVDITVTLSQIIFTTIGALWDLGLDRDEIEQALEILCDTKNENFVLPNERVNLLFKGTENE